MSTEPPLNFNNGRDNPDKSAYYTIVVGSSAVPKADQLS